MKQSIWFLCRMEFSKLFFASENLNPEIQNNLEIILLVLKINKM